MVNTLAVAEASKGFWPLTKQIVSITFITVIIGILFLSAVIHSIQEGSIKPLVAEIGGKLALSTKNLDLKSQQINSPDFESLSSWEKISLYSEAMASLSLILFTIKLFAWIVSRPLGGSSSTALPNYLIAIILFLLLQSLFILMVTNYHWDVGYQVNPDDAFKAPYHAFYEFGKTIPRIVQMIIKPVEKLGWGNNNYTNGSSIPSSS